MKDIGGYRILDTVSYQKDGRGKPREVFVAKRGDEKFLLTVFDEGSRDYRAEKSRRDGAPAGADLSDETVRSINPSVRFRPAPVHPNILHVSGMQWDGDTLFMVADHFDKTIDDWIEATGPLSVRDVVSIGMAICDVSEGRGQNDARAEDPILQRYDIYISDDSQIKVAQFSDGVRFFRVDPRFAALANAGNLNPFGQIIRFREYTAPELGWMPDTETEEVWRLARLHCFGQLLFELLTQVPIAKRHQPGLLPIAKINPTVPDALAQIVEVLLADNPSDRFQTFGEVAARLRGLDLHHQSLDCVSGGQKVDPIRAARSARLKFPEPAIDFDFRRINWGVTQDEVRNSERGGSDVDWPGDGYYAIEVNGREFTLTYLFTDEAAGESICAGALIQPQGFNVIGYVDFAQPNSPGSFLLPEVDPEEVAELLPEEQQAEYLESRRGLPRIPNRDVSLTPKTAAAKADFDALHEFLNERYGAPTFNRKLSESEIRDYAGELELTGDQKQLNRLVGWQTSATDISLQLMPFICGGLILQAQFTSREHGHLLQ